MRCLHAVSPARRACCATCLARALSFVRVLKQQPTPLPSRPSPAQVSVFINMFVTCVFAAGFYGAALQDIGLENAGQYLGDAYGPAMVVVWALGLLAAGQSSTMSGTFTGVCVRVRCAAGACVDTVHVR